MNKSTKKLLIGGGVAIGGMTLAAGLVIGAGMAKADVGDDTAAATCHVLRQDFDGNVADDGAIAVGVAAAIADHYGIGLINAVRVENYQVETYCPSLWPELQAIGAHARYADGTPGTVA